MRRLAIIVLLSLLGFVAALATFDNVSWQACIGDGPADPSYQVAFVQPVTAGQIPSEFELRHDGEPVTGAHVCLQAARGANPPLGGEAREVAAGRYQVAIDFRTAGTWTGSVLLADPGADPQAEVPVTVQVRP